MPAHTCRIMSISWSHVDENLIISSSVDGYLKLWNLTDLTYSLKLIKTVAPQLDCKWISQPSVLFNYKTMRSFFDPYIAYTDDFHPTKIIKYTDPGKVFSLLSKIPKGVSYLAILVKLPNIFLVF